MKQAPSLLLAVLTLTAAIPVVAEDIILRLRPEPTAPIVTRMTATEKVLMDAAPTEERPDWRQLKLKFPFEGYVPAAALTKNFAILDKTPVHTLPDANTDIITRARDGDHYEILRVSDDWATVRLKKELTTYFQPAPAGSPATKPIPEPIPAPRPEPIPEPPVLDLSPSAPTHTPEPNAVDYDPDRAVGQTSPDDLPPENVVWESSVRAAATSRKPQSQDDGTTDHPEATTRPYSEESAIIVSRGDTQARESGPNPPTEPDKPLRFLVGTLVREIETSDPAYPVRLRSDEGRLISYVDFSGYFIEDLSPYLEQRVYLRGHIAPVKPDSKELVLFVRDIRLAD